MRTVLDVSSVAFPQVNGQERTLCVESAACTLPCPNVMSNEARVKDNEAKPRHRPLTTVDAERIVIEIGKLDASLRPDWNAILKITQTVDQLKPGWSRPTLSKHPIVAGAYAAAIKAFREGKRSERKLPPSRDVGALRAENKALRDTLKAYDARFATWTYNAFLYHVTVDQLDAPLR